jgi:hypothetical protein
MPRLSLTLDAGTASRLEAYARRRGIQPATMATDFIREALNRYEAAVKRTKLAAGYAADRDETRRLLQDFEAGELTRLE